MAEKKSKKKLVLGGCGLVGCGGVLLLLVVVVVAAAVLVFPAFIEEKTGIAVPRVAAVEDLGLDEMVGGWIDSGMAMVEGDGTGEVTDGTGEDTGGGTGEGATGDTGEGATGDTGEGATGDTGEGDATADTGEAGTGEGEKDDEEPTPEPEKEDPTPEPEKEDPTPEPEKDDGDSSTSGGRGGSETVRPDRGDDDDEEEVEVTITHSAMDMAVVGDSMSVSAKTPGVSSCRLRLYWRAPGGSWAKVRMSSSGESHSGSLTVTSEMKPEFEYYLKTSGCSDAKWPSSGYQTVRVF